jgi:pimeloyl-ACP methyl ester carboxylesterase
MRELREARVDYLVNRLIRWYKQFITSGEPRDEDRVASHLMHHMKVTPVEARKMASHFVRTDPDYWYQSYGDFTMFDGIDADALMERIVCPVLLLHGERSRGSVLTTADIDRITAHLRQVSVHGVTGAGHALHSQATEEFLRVVTGFLTSLAL